SASRRRAAETANECCHTPLLYRLKKQKPPIRYAGAFLVFRLHFVLPCLRRASPGRGIWSLETGLLLRLFFFGFGLGGSSASRSFFSRLRSFAASNELRRA